MIDLMLVLAHPDDESFMGGATLARAAAGGVATALLCLTDGQAGRRGLTGGAPLADDATIGAVRREELRRAVERLRIGELITPGLIDGALARVPEAEGIALVAGHVRRLRPRVLISFGPEGAPNRHPDHIASARWAAAAFEQTDVEKYYWITWPPEADALRGTAGEPITAEVELGAEFERLKLAAFDEHRTQVDHRPLFTRMLEINRGREYFHLARHRLAQPPQAFETDLMAGLAPLTPARGR